MRLDATDAQIVFVDAQSALVSNTRTSSLSEIGKSCGVLADCAGLFDLPMTFSLVEDGSEGPSLLPQLQLYQTTANSFVRDCATPLTDRHFAEAIARHGRPKLVISGYATEVVVAHTAMGALAAGYEVYLPVDAIGSMSARTESAVLQTIQRAGGILSSVATVVTMLEPDFSTERGKHVIGSVRTLSE